MAKAKKTPICVPVGEAGFKFRNVRGLKGSQIYSDANNFGGHFPDIEDLHQIGRMYIDGYDAEAVGEGASQMIWDYLMTLEVKADGAKTHKVKGPKMIKGFTFNVNDPTKWAKAPTQIKVILDSMFDAGITDIGENEMKDHMKKLVNEGKLVTRQDPFQNVFMYYVKDKKRGFHPESTVEWHDCCGMEETPVIPPISA